MDDPKVTIGQRPDGKPWVIDVEFAHGVRINGFSALKDGQYILDPAKARAKAEALMQAAEWVESGRNAAIEKRMTEDPTAKTAWFERGELPS